MHQRMRALSKKLDLATYARDKLVDFRIVCGGEVSDETMVSVPVPILYRYYHIGRAYDFHQIKNLQPTGSVSLDFVASQMLCAELEQVGELVNDPVIHAYNAKLLSLLKTARTNTAARLVMQLS